MEMICPACSRAAPSVPGVHRTEGGRLPPRPGQSGEQPGQAGNTEPQPRSQQLQW